MRWNLGVLLSLLGRLLCAHAIPYRLLLLTLDQMRADLWLLVWTGEMIDLNAEQYSFERSGLLLPRAG